MTSAAVLISQRGRRPSCGGASELVPGAAAAAVLSPVVAFDRGSICDVEPTCEDHFGGETGGVVDAAPAVEPGGASGEDRAGGVTPEDEVVYERRGCGGLGGASSRSVVGPAGDDGGAVYEIYLRSVLQVRG